MKRLPTGWATSQLGEVLPIRYGKALKATSRAEHGDVPVIGSSGVIGFHDEPYTSGPAVIVGRKGNVGSVYFSRGACWPIDTVFFAETTGVDLSFFAHQISFLTLGHLDQSTAIPGLSRDHYNVHEIAVPPLPEQHRIVEAIESHFTRLAEAVATLERVQRNLKRYRASVLKAAVEGRLVPTEAELARAEARDYEPASILLERILAERRRCWEENERAKMRAKGRTPKDDKRLAKYEEPRRLETSAKVELPAGWIWVTLDQLTTSIDGGAPTTATSQMTSRRVLRSSAVRQGSIDFEDHRFLPEDAPASESSVLADGDLLFTRLSGTLAYVGNCAVVPPLLGRRFEFPDRIFRARMNSFVLGEYVALCFGVLDLRRRLESAAKSTAGHQRISLSDLREFEIPLPPRAEQSRIVAEVERAVSVIGSAESAAHTNVRRCLRFRQAILKWAFEGRLADQEPTDEPASVLLERIKAERAGSATTKQAKKPRRSTNA